PRGRVRVPAEERRRAPRRHRGVPGGRSGGRGPCASLGGGGPPSLGRGAGHGRRGGGRLGPGPRTGTTGGLPSAVAVDGDPRASVIPPWRPRRRRGAAQ